MRSISEEVIKKASYFIVNSTTMRSVAGIYKDTTQTIIFPGWDTASYWYSINDTEYLLSIPGMREKIIEGLRTPIEECSEEPGW
jgi:uncharacterized membrane protein YpjA